MKIPQNLTDLSQDAIVELFQLDTSTAHNIDQTNVTEGETFCWTPGTLGNEPVSFGGVVYTPYPIMGDKFEWNGQGKAPQPVLQMMNLGGVITGLTIKLDDLVGATVKIGRASCRERV